MADESDNLFAVLGSSLMKDLLANLNDDDDNDGFLTFDQLEQELAVLERAPPPQQDPRTSAASLVVHQQQPAAASTTTAAPVDAWSLSLAKFASSSLEQEFLLADTERKQAPAKPPGLDFSEAKEYDTSDDVVAPPPGLLDNAKILSSIQGEPKAASAPPMPRKVPPTPQTSMAMGAPTPRNSIVEPASQESKPVAFAGQVPQSPPVPPAAYPKVPHNTPVMAPVMASPMMPPLVATPVTGAAPWQSPPPVRMQPTKVYMNPRGPPIPANDLESRYMKARDISFVVHGILRPVLAAGTQPTDYDVLFWNRHAGTDSATFTPKHKMERELQIRREKAKEWSSEKSTLGLVTKTNVTRPRALLAQPLTDAAAPKQQRATLWKARIYCDQAYQAYDAVVEAWRRAPQGQLPSRAVHTPLHKLLKCMGLSLSQEAGPQDYQVDKEALELLLKLPKGRVLLARSLEHALLPPKAVHILLPFVLDILYPQPENDRLFAAWTFVLATLPNWPGPTLLQAIQLAQDHSPQSLSAPARMQCIHAILQRASALAGESADFAQLWKPAEEKFVQVLTGLS